MEQDIAELELETADDHWPLDHHLEELLGALTDAARALEIGSDDVEEPFE
jgi:hypothetical protein